jgi:hypothetical protein
MIRIRVWGSASTSSVMRRESDRPHLTRHALQFLWPSMLPRERITKGHPKENTTVFCCCVCTQGDEHVLSQAV